MCGLSSHLGGVFGVSMTFGRQFDVIFDNFVPLSHRKLGRLTFLQGNHSYNIEIPNYDKVIKGAYKQIDFCKDRVLIEVQFGKYAFMFYDLAKFQYFFNENKAAVGIEIVPSHSLKTEMSSGVSFGEQLVYDIERLKRHFPAVPIKVIFIDTDSDL
jgi:hypothetical protein